MLLEAEGLHIGKIDFTVDQGELLFRKLFGHLLDGIGLRHTDTDDQSHLSPSQSAMKAFNGLKVAGLDVLEINPQLFPCPDGTFVGGGIETFVIFAAFIEDQTDLRIGRPQR